MNSSGDGNNLRVRDYFEEHTPLQVRPRTGSRISEIRVNFVCGNLAKRRVKKRTVSGNESTSTVIARNCAFPFVSSGNDQFTGSPSNQVLILQDESTAGIIRHILAWQRFSTVHHRKRPVDSWAEPSILGDLPATREPGRSSVDWRVLTTEFRRESFVTTSFASACWAAGGGGFRASGRRRGRGS